ncbi:MAG TPA: response regulator [Syntrophorhabdaceae bacterium]|nr:response regulator [Syntrophorhabdaceae bacterium]
MAESILNGKRILIVDDEPDILAVVEEGILLSCPNCTIDKAANYEKGAQLLDANSYDVVILDIMGVRGFDLLEIAVKRKFRVAMLTGHALNPEALAKSHDMGAMAYIPKDKIGELVPFLEDVLTNDYKTGWKRLMDKLEAYLNARWEKDWKTKTNIAYWY